MKTIITRRSFIAAATVPLAVSTMVDTPPAYLVLLHGPSKRQPHGGPRVASVVNDAELAQRLTRKLNKRGLSAEVVPLGKGGVA